jgi:hypothetical protein
MQVVMERGQVDPMRSLVVAVVLVVLAALVLQDHLMV